MKNWGIEQLKYWWNEVSDLEMVKNWSVEKLKCWKIEELKCWRIEVLKNWSFEELKFWRIWNDEELKEWEDLESQRSKEMLKNWNVECWSAEELKCRRFRGLKNSSENENGEELRYSRV